MSKRIGAALNFLRAFGKENSLAAGHRQIPVGNHVGKSVPVLGKQRALGVGNSMMGRLDEDEEAGDEEDEDEEEDDLDEPSDDGDEADTDEEYDPVAPKGPLENNNYGEIWLPVQARPRRNRKNYAMRKLVQESLVKPSSLIYPLFVHDEVRSQRNSKQAFGARGRWMFACLNGE